MAPLLCLRASQHAGKLQVTPLPHKPGCPAALLVHVAFLLSMPCWAQGSLNRLSAAASPPRPQELWNFPIWGKGVKDHYHPPAPLLLGPSGKKAC